MSTSVESKVVELKFDNSDFNKKVVETLSRLEEFDKKLKELEQSKSLENVSKQPDASKVTEVTDAVEETRRQFSTLEVVAITALANITNSVVNLGKKLVNNLISPITQGGLQRAMNIEQASFQFEGMNLDKSKGNEALSYYKEVMDAVLGTAYSYDVAAKAASQLAASNIGVADTTRKLADGSKISSKVLTSDMTKALLGIAGVASMTGSDFDSIAQIFTRVAGQGKVMATDLNSIAARGLNASAVLAQSMNVTEAKVRDMVSKGKVSFNDFSTAMYEAYGDHAKDATQLFTGAMEDVKAALSRIGADFFGPALTAARDVLNSVTPLIDELHNRIQNNIDGINKSMGYVAKQATQYFSMITLVMGGINSGKTPDVGEYAKSYARVADLLGTGSGLAQQGIDKLNAGIKGIKIDGIAMLADYLSTNKNSVVSGLKKGTIGLEDFTNALNKLYAKSTNLQSIDGMGDAIKKLVNNLLEGVVNSNEFKNSYGDLFSVINGLNSVIKLAGSIMLNLAKSIGNVVKTLSPLGKLILEVIVLVGQLLERLTSAIAKSGAIEGFLSRVVYIFEQLASVLHINEFLANVYTAIVNIFDFAETMLTAIGHGVEQLTTLILNVLDGALNKLASIIEDTSVLSVIWKDFRIATLLAILAKIYSGIVKPLKALKDLTTVATGFFNTVVKNFKDSIEAISKLGKVITKVFSSLTKVLNEMQKTLKGALLLEIAGALLVLCFALKILASIDIDDPKKLVAPLVGLVSAFGMMFVILNYINKISEASKKAKEITSVGDFLKSFAEKIVNTKNDAIGLLKQASIMLLAASVSLAIIGKTIEGLAKYDWKHLIAPFAIIELVLLSLFAFVKFLSTDGGTTISWEKGFEHKSQSMTKGLLSLVAVAEAIKIVGDAIGGLAKYDWKQLIAPVVAVEIVAVTMAGIAKVLSSDKKKYTSGALSLLALSISVAIVAKALKSISSVPKDALENSTMAIVGLTILLGLMAKMLAETEGLKLEKGLSLIAIAYSFKMLADVMSELATMEGDIETAGTVLAAIAVGLAVIANVLDSLKSFGIGDGVALLLIGGAIYVIANALINLSQVPIDQLGNALETIAGVLLMLGLACKAFEQIKFGAILKFLLTLGGTVVLIAAAGIALSILSIGMRALASAVKPMAEVLPYLPEFAAALTILAASIVGAGEILTASLPALGAALVTFMVAVGGIYVMAKSFEMMSDAFERLSKIDATALKTVSLSIYRFIEGCSSLVSSADEIAAGANKLSTSFEKLNSVIKSASTTFDDLKKVGSNVVKKIADGISSEKAFANIKAAINTLFSNIKSHIESKQPQWKDMGSYLIKGMIQGIRSQQKDLETEVKKLEEKAERAVEAKAKIKSPSRVWMKIGSFMAQGLAIGISKASNLVTSAAETVATVSTSAVSSAVEKISDMVQNGIDASPTIRPVVDLSNVVQASSAIGSIMASRRAMAISASVSSQPSALDVATGNLLTGMKDVFGASVVSNQNGSGVTQLIVPLTINGREFARATVDDMQAEINRASVRSDRLVGVY